MRKILSFALVITLLSSCSLLRSPAVLISDTLDYSSYQQKGFFITEATSVNFDYSPVSSVSALNITGYKVVNKSNNKNMDDIYGTENTKNPVRTTSQVVYASRRVVLDELYKRAKETGADGILRLEIKYFKNFLQKGVYEEGFTGSGMAIKRSK